MKRLILFMLISVISNNANATTTKTIAPSNNYYALSTTVTDVDYKTDVVTVTDHNGNEWQFSGCEDWMTGGGCALVMNNMGTEIIYDDEIVNTRYFAK